MYSDQPNILQLAALLREHGVKDVVLCPGSRNAPIVHTLAETADYHCLQETDERNAGFLAIGIALATGRPAAVCVTSGSALVNLHPAVVEAYYQQVPLIVISADRPAAWIGQLDGQTLPQPGVFGTMVRCAVNLPEIHTAEDEWYCNRLINEALIAATSPVKGPIHINIPLSEPLYRFTTDTLPNPRVIHRVNPALDQNESGNGLLRQQADVPRRLIVIGQMPPHWLADHRLTSALTALSHSDVCLAEHIANCSACPDLIGNFDVTLYGRTPEELEALRPDLLITCGGHIVSKRLKQFLRRYPPRYHWHVSPDGAIADTFGCLTLAVKSDAGSFLRRDLLRFLQSVGTTTTPTDYHHHWLQLSRNVPPPSLPFSAPGAVGDVISALPPHSVLHLANSSTVRYAQLFPIAPANDIDVNCNRGVNGIEGSLPTIVGYASASERINIAIIGDLSFFYAMNAIARPKPIRSNLRLVLLNNFGGGIFHTLPGMPHDQTMRYIVGEHRTTAREWAQVCGFDYLEATDEKTWQKACRQLTTSANLKRPVLVEVFTRMEDDAEALRTYYRSTTQG